MAGELRNLLNRNGRYFARIVVPKDLRNTVGKAELRASLGPDRRLAIRRLPTEVAKFLDVLAEARRVSGHERRTPRRPLTAIELAHLHYDELLQTDDRRRDLPPELTGITVPSWNRFISDARIKALARVVSGEARDDEIGAHVGESLDVLLSRGIIDAPRGSVEWRAIARLLASVEIEAQTRSNERDVGYYGGAPKFPPLTQPRPADLHVESVPFTALLADYTGELQRSGRGAEAARRWRPCIENLVSFLKHDDAQSLSRQDVLNWRDKLLTTLTPKTVRDAHMSALKAILQWGVDSGRLKENLARRVKVRVPANIQTRERGLTEAEAKAVLSASLNYTRNVRKNARTSESACTAAAKRWIPWLCAFTGARVAEMAQLRKADVRLNDAVAHVRITPDAGSVKSGQFRDVPLHPQLLDLGFGDFVRQAAEGPLFFDGGSVRRSERHPSKQVAQRVAVWVRSLNVISTEVDPNHGWRHRMKTVARELGLDMRIVDAIQGHAPRTAGERYGDISLAAKENVIKRFPHYDVGRS